jgi:hypothetical protein
MAQQGRQHFQRFRLRFEGDQTRRLPSTRAIPPGAYRKDAVDRRRNVERPIIVEDQVGRLGSLCRHVQANDVAGVAALSPRVESLAIPAPELVDGNPKVDLAITGDVRAVPTLHLVKQRDGCADDIRALIGQQPAQPRVAHRRSPPMACAVVEIFGDRSTERVAIEEDCRTTGGTQPATQLPAHGCLAGAG